MNHQSYINQDKLPYPFCPGCSHGTILDKLDEAMQQLGLDTDKVVIVTDIGCIGLADQWFTTHAFHGLHGRSVLYGQGLKLASPELHVIVLIGDGGAGIGTHHLIHAARRNIDITVVLCNNFNFGMTGGQHSVCTPYASRASTFPEGTIEAPLKMAETAALNGAAFTARRAFYDTDLAAVLSEAITGKGYSFVEILEFCTAYYLPKNNFRKSDLEKLVDGGVFPRISEKQQLHADYSEAYKKNKAKSDLSQPIKTKNSNNLQKDISIILAGSAGQKVRTVARCFSRAAVASGLYAVQRDDYPVTIKSGHSVSYITLSSSRIRNPSQSGPDYVMVFSRDGLLKISPALGTMATNSTVFHASDLAVTCSAQKQQVLFPENKNIDDLVAAIMVIIFLEQENIFPVESFVEEIITSFGDTTVDRICMYLEEMPQTFNSSGGGLTFCQ